MQRTLQDWLEESPFTLALSSSFFGFFAHCGVITALEERGLHPRRATGASAGALVAAAVASDIPAKELRQILFDCKREDFWDPAIGFGYLKGDRLRKTLSGYLVKDFSQTKIPVGVAVFDLLKMRTDFLDEGELPQAVVASCTVPGMVHPVKRNGRILFDGGVLRKSGMQHEKKSEKIFGVFLEADGLSGWYERKTEGYSHHPAHRVLRFKKFPRVSYNRLHDGPAAFEALYKRTLASLDRKIGFEQTEISGF